tara:strand:+ start:301 stop:489 length:189 start_codon:yes stop_codon:yes gene_type:complete
MDRNALLTITSCVYFSIAIAHTARVILGGEIILFSISFPYIVSVLIAAGFTYLGWKSLNYID